jgi:hypothetical protein
MGRKHRSGLGPSAFRLPDDVPTLDPEWVACLTVYWRNQSPAVARDILLRIEAAMYESAPERSVHRLQQALRELGMVEIQILKLVLSRHCAFIRMNAPYPAQQIATQVLATLLDVEQDRRRAGPPRLTGS